MTNPYYNETFTAALGSQARSRALDNEFQRIQAAFDALDSSITALTIAAGRRFTLLEDCPSTLTAAGLKLVRVNAAASALEFVASGNVTVRTVAGTGYTLVASDAGAVVLTSNSSAVTVTVPPSVFAQGDVVMVNQYGAGQVTFAPGSGVTIRSSDDLLRTRTRYAQVALVCLGSNEFALIGERNAAAPSGGGTMPGSGWAQYLCAALEPDAIEAVQFNSFTYAVGSSETKLLLASWGTRLGASGRMEQRNPQKFMPLRNVTLTGLGSGATAVIVDPTVPTYTDPWTTYYARLEAMAELPVQNIAFTATSQRVPFLPGAYGAVITQYTCFDFAWLALRPLGGTVIGVNLWDEISDSATQRIGDSLTFAVSKGCAGSIQASSAGSTPLGSVSFVLLPSTWSVVDDPVSASYTFRDDFMGAALDTGVWTRAQSTAGNVEIDTTYQWCKLAGNSGWGNNGLRRTSTAARAAGTKLVVDVYVPVGGAASGAFMVGWNDGAGHAVANYIHAINFAPTNVINVYEAGVSRGTVGAGYTEGTIYRLRITQGASAATYEIQGGVEYEPIGGAAWDDITPGGTSSSVTPLTPGATAFAAVGYVSDFRVF